MTERFRADPTKNENRPNVSNRIRSAVECDRNNPKRPEHGRRPSWETVRGLPINRTYIVTGPIHYSHARACCVSVS